MRVWIRKNKSVDILLRYETPFHRKAGEAAVFVLLDASRQRTIDSTTSSDEFLSGRTNDCSSRIARSLSTSSLAYRSASSCRR